MMSERRYAGHLLALMTILIWGTTFVSTKLLLKDFTPMEILFFRFLIGYLMLLLIYPRRIKTLNIKQELYFASAGLFGVTLYFLFENIALTYTFASNVGVIVSISPFFTAIFAHIFLESEKFTMSFFIGFVVAVIGIVIVGFNGNFVLKLNPIGDVLAVFATIAWAAYSVVMKKITEFEFNNIACTRKVFFYGLLFMIPIMFMFKPDFTLNRFVNTRNLFNILYLGLGASAVCFVTWNYSVKILGVVKTSVYIYAVPVVTVIASVIVLKESITGIAIIGIILTLIGLFISEEKQFLNLRRKVNDIRTRYKMRYSDR